MPGKQNPLKSKVEQTKKQIKSNKAQTEEKPKKRQKKAMDKQLAKETTLEDKKKVISEDPKKKRLNRSADYLDTFSKIDASSIADAIISTKSKEKEELYPFDELPEGEEDDHDDDSSYSEETSLRPAIIDQIKECYSEKFKDQAVKPIPGQHSREEFISTIEKVFGTVKIVHKRPQYNNKQQLILKYHKNQITIEKKKERKSTITDVSLIKPSKTKSPTKKSVNLHIKYLDPVSFKIATEKDYLESKDEAIVAQAISFGLDHSVKTKYVERDIKQYIDELQSLEAPQALNAVKDRLLVPEYAVFKAVAFSYDEFLSEDEIVCQLWFTDVIQPILKSPYYQSNLELSSLEDLQKIAKIIKQIRSIATIIDEQKAIKVCSILKKAGPFADFIRRQLSQTSFTNLFWKQAVMHFFNYDKQDQALVDVIVNNKECLFTDALISFKDQKSIQIKFLVALSKFQPLTFDELTQFYKKSIDEQFFTLTDLLKPTNTQCYMRIDNKQQMETLKFVLKDKPLDQWREFKDQIFSAIADLDDKYATKLVSETFTNLAKKLLKSPLDKDYRDTLECDWSFAKQVFQDCQILLKDWQKEIVYNVLDLFYKKKEKFIVVQLDTGHGKSIICQEIATMMHYIDQSISIVTCANEFLATYSQFAYSSDDQQTYLQYVSLDKLLSMDVTDQVIITDEHDIMAGLNSFFIIESDNGSKITGKYTPSIYQRAKGLIAFSGTISSATKQQLNWFIPKAIFVEIPSLQNDRQRNVIKNYIHLQPTMNLFDQVVNTIQQESESSNFIVIFNDAITLNAFKQKQQKYLNDKKVFVFEDFQNPDSYPAYSQKLKDLSLYDFIVLTVKDGCRGVDFKGRKPAHVIIACDIDNYSQLIQALGRGSRDIKNIATGTLISSQDYGDKSNILQILINQDQLKGKQALLNHITGQLLHDKQRSVIKLNKEEIKLFKEEHSKGIAKLQENQEQGALELMMFQSHCSNGMSFLNNDGLILWKFIKKRFDTSLELPDDPKQFNLVQYLKKFH